VKKPTGTRINALSKLGCPITNIRHKITILTAKNLENFQRQLVLRNQNYT
jgi:hypothetical protein